MVDPGEGRRSAGQPRSQGEADHSTVLDPALTCSEADVGALSQVAAVAPSSVRSRRRRRTPGSRSGNDQSKINPDPRLLPPRDCGRAVITEPLADLDDQFPGGVVVRVQGHRAPRCIKRGTKIICRERIPGRLRTDLGSQQPQPGALLDDPFGRADLRQ